MNLNINLNVDIDLSDEYLESRLDYFMQTIKTIQEKHNLTCTVQPVINKTDEDPVVLPIEENVNSDPLS
jgi:hypothetical protein